MKKKMSVFFAVLLAAVMCFPAAAAGPPKVSLSSGEVKPGQSVTLTASIEDNPGLVTCMVYFYYDTSVFTADREKDIAAAGGFREVGGVLSNTIAEFVKGGAYDGDPGKEGLLALWFNMSAEITHGDGPIFSLTLHANANAPQGEYPIGLGYSARNTAGGEIGALQKVELATVGGTVSVKNDAPERTDPIPEPNEPDVQDFIDSSGKPEDPNKPTTPNEPEASVFSDISGSWAKDYIVEIARRNVMNGVGNGKYAPESNMKRCEYATILWRSKGSPEPKGASSFTDLDVTKDWYLKAVAWAEETGVMNGVGNGKFNPDGDVTREQLVTILHRLAGSPTGMETTLGSVYDGQFKDSGEISSWAKPSVYWAVFNEIYCGENSVKFESSLAPKAAADRAQIAVMMVKYLEKEEKNK